MGDKRVPFRGGAIDPKDEEGSFYRMSLAEYVKVKGGKNAITKVLIANNGIGAVKCMRSIKRWSYETFGRDDMIKFVAMATPDDIKANAAYIHLADEYVQVPPGSNNNNYANVKLIVKIAERCGVQAVWPGWGHASENPVLPDMLAETKDKIIWIGPPSSAMRALGDKIGSTLIAQSAGVPCMPWSGSGITVDYENAGIPDDVYTSACVNSAEECLAVAERIGYPIMIKASEGGGGKGIRMCKSADAVLMGFRQVQGEVPGSPIFAMRLAPECRHLEVQLLADEWGDAIAVFGRDCSIQRRHQKIIEEGPVLAAPHEKWREMEKAAVKLAKEVGYVGCGTVEYLFYGNNEYCFLELNPRLQVEHTVTELISGVNLPAAQLQVAMGIPLHQLRGVRKMFGEHPLGESRIDFDNTEAQSTGDHVIACRITAENPDDKFTPTGGQIHEMNFRSSPNVWGYFSVAASGGSIHEFSDSQFGHIFASGRSREAARRNMGLALKELDIRGDIRTTVEYLREIIENQEFSRNQVSTSWLERVMEKEEITMEKPATHLVAILGAVYKAFVQTSQNQDAYMTCLERGQLPSPALHNSLVSANVELIYEDIKYAFKVFKSGLESFDVQLNDWNVTANVLSLSDGGILVTLDGKKHIVYGKEFPSGLRLTIDSQTCLFTKEYDPTRLCTAVQGKLVRFLVGSGEHVTKGQPYAELEVMKMYITIKAPEAGLIRHIKPELSVVEAGEQMAALTLDDPSAVQKATPFSGKLPKLSAPTPFGEEVNTLLVEAVKVLNLVLDGYKTAPARSEQALNTMMACLRHPALPLTQWNECTSALTGRIPPELWDAFETIAGNYGSSLSMHKFQWERPDSFPIIDLQNAIDQCLSTLGDAEATTLRANLDGSGCTALLESYADGNHTYAVSTITSLLERFLEIENIFNGQSAEEVINRLRKEKQGIVEISRAARAHHGLADRSNLVVGLLRVVDQDLSPLLGDFVPVVRRLSNLAGAEYGRIGLKTRQIIMRNELPSSQQRSAAIRAILSSCAAVSGDQKLERLTPLLDQSQAIEDVIFSFFNSKDKRIQKVAMEVCIRRVYSGYAIKDVAIDNASDVAVADWSFASGSKSDLLGSMAYFNDFDQLKRSFSAVADKFSSTPKADNSGVMYAVCRWASAIPNDTSLVGYLQTILSNYAKSFQNSFKGVRRVTFVMSHGNDQPKYFTFRGMVEDRKLRHVEPAYAMHMELERLSNFDLSFVPGLNLMTPIYKGKAIAPPKNRRGPEPERLFVRALVRKLDSVLLYDEETSNKTVDTHPEIEFAFVEGLNAIEIATEGVADKFKNNHIFINVLVPAEITVEYMHKVIRHLARTYADKINRLNVSHTEILLRLKENNKVREVRIYYCNPTGYMLLVDTYEQVASSSGAVHKYLPNSAFKRPLHLNANSLPYFDGKPTDEPYPVQEPFQVKRSVAESVGTLYVYDFLVIFEKAMAEQWKSHGKGQNTPKQFVRATELILDPKDNTKLVETTRAPGLNDIGMVAWRLTLFTPFAPQGRDIVLISNDISHQMGSFGPAEDDLFDLASKYSREHRLPRLYFTCNSGARIGMAEEVKQKFQIAWKNDSTQNGYEYLYLSEPDYNELKEYVKATKISVGGQVRYKITDIIGKAHGMGVECLSGSGKIAGETSRAYEDVFTLTLVTGRTVGIGAYLARLGQRCIQKNAPPILLTGYMALNKLLGKQVYSSNNQLGGIDIMYNNGVSHLTCKSDMEGVQQTLEWLNYVPNCREAALPVSPSLEDPVDRLVEYRPPATPYDPRNMLAGVQEGDKWLSGFFDKGSWMEVLGGWARSVICGRARLGGYPMGVIAVEARTVEQYVPADPANENSKEQIIQRAGQVWFPESAFKTAQGIKDMIAEDIPLMLFANWRGFSGGMTDMFDEVLKYGALIVDALVEYRQPVFVYLPPNGTLRGGAWVVVDSTINEEYMEMYADPSSRGGVLEAEGIVEVKYRKHQLIQTMHRLDDALVALDAELASGSKRAGIAAEIAAREKALMPYYHTVATAFADLHDTPGRMEAKNVIRCPVEWTNSRVYFYWRMRRRVAESRITRDIQSADSSIAWKEASTIVRGLIVDDLGADVAAKVLSDDKAATEWLLGKSKFLEASIAQIGAKSVAKRIQGMIAKDAGSAINGIMVALQGLGKKERAKALEALAK